MQTSTENVPTVIFFNTTRAWGGGEKWHLEMATHFRNRGLRLVLFAHPHGLLYQKARAEGLPVIPFATGKLSFLNPAKLLKLAGLFLKFQAGAIIMNLPQDMKLAGLAARKAGIPKIIYRRGSAIPIKNSFINRFYFRKIITQVISNTNATAATILEKNPNLFPKEKIHTIHNGINLPWYAGYKSETLPNTKFVVGIAARFEKQKGLHHLIPVAQQLKEMKIDFEIHIAGSGSLEDEIKALVEKNNLMLYFKFLGFQTDIRPFMHSIDVFVLTSHWEGFGYVLVEAMAARKPVVAWNISSNPEIVLHEKTGILVPPFDTQAMAKAISVFTDKNLQENYGQLGYERVEQNFTIDRSVQKVLSLLFPDIF